MKCVNGPVFIVTEVGRGTSLLDCKILRPEPAAASMNCCDMQKGLVSSETQIRKPSFS